MLDTLQAIKNVYPKAMRLEIIVPLIDKYLAQYKMDTVNRKSMFLAQCLLESGGFRYLKEIWGDTVWQKRYEGHKGLGNTQPGDGKRFMGRGLIQLTGRKNYQAFANWLNDSSVMQDPEVVARPDYAVLSAIWFWTSNNLNKFADADDIKGCTRVINGKAMLHLDLRTKYYEGLKTAFTA